MKSGKYVAYYRVSTGAQGRSGLEAQREAVARYAGTGEILAEYTEVESGKKSANRPQLAAALQDAKRRRAILVIATLDRLARNLHFVTGLMESRVPFVAADAPDDEPFILHMRAAWAQEEARKISQRTKAALAAARARRTKLGGRRVSVDRFAQIAKEGRLVSAKVRSAATIERRKDMAPVIEGLQAWGVGSLSKLAAALNERGIRAPRGGEWSPAQVRRVLPDAVVATSISFVSSGQPS
jgi:DNA invertase Pin-like site-specific DNA recombinase